MIAIVTARVVLESIISHDSREIEISNSLLHIHRGNLRYKASSSNFIISVEYFKLSSQCQSISLIPRKDQGLSYLRYSDNNNNNNNKENGERRLFY